jgi:hypothetical protein
MGDLYIGCFVFLLAPGMVKVLMLLVVLST